MYVFVWVYVFVCVGVCDVSLCVGVYVFVCGGVYVCGWGCMCLWVGVCVGVWVYVFVWLYVICGCVVGTAVDSWLCSVFSSSVDQTKLLECLLFLLPLSLLTC